MHIATDYFLQAREGYLSLDFKDRIEKTYLATGILHDSQKARSVREADLFNRATSLGCLHSSQLKENDSVGIVKVGDFGEYVRVYPK